MDLVTYFKVHNNGRKEGREYQKWCKEELGWVTNPSTHPIAMDLYRALLLNGCKGLSLAYSARFQVVLNGGIDRHGSYKPLWLGNASFRGMFSSAKQYPWCCGGEALTQSCYPWDVSMFVRNEVNPSFIGGARITHSLGSTTPLGLEVA